jgi:hypothetical protein
MHRFPKILLLTIGFGLVGVAVGFLTSTPAPAAPTSVPVTVVNTPSAPVPTAAQGTTAISGNVGISAGTKINVANVPDANGNPTPVVVRDHTPTQPFHMFLCSDYGTLSGSCQTVVPAANSSFQVPTTTSDGHAVERMVIENISGVCASTGSGQQVFEVILSTTLNENSPIATISDIFPAAPSAAGLTATVLIQTVSQTTRLYSDPGSQVGLSFGITGNSADGSRCNMTLTGYLTTL